LSTNKNELGVLLEKKVMKLLGMSASTVEVNRGRKKLVCHACEQSESTDVIDWIGSFLLSI